jgi:hypothetical protein
MIEGDIVSLSVPGTDLTQTGIRQFLRSAKCAGDSLARRDKASSHFVSYVTVESDSEAVYVRISAIRRSSMQRNASALRYHCRGSRPFR